MTDKINIASKDGHNFGAYIAEPQEQTGQGLVILQEIFGVNTHIREVCDSYSSYGFTSLAPSLFDRTEKNVELNYLEKDIKKGRTLKSKIGWEKPLLDIQASIDFLRKRNCSKIGVLGYCWGGSLAFLSACRLSPDATIGYYGGQIIEFYSELPRCPTILHFGSEDTTIPISNVEKISNQHPQIGVYVYKGANHGFNCNKRSDFDSKSSKQALSRTLDHLREHLR